MHKTQIPEIFHTQLAQKSIVYEVVMRVRSTLLGQRMFMNFHNDSVFDVKTVAVGAFNLQ